MQQPDIKEWINLAPDITIRRFRQAVHTILAAIAGSPALQTNMIMKGGVLLALGYGFGADLTVLTGMTVSAGQPIADELGQLRRRVRQIAPTTSNALTEWAVRKRCGRRNRQGHGRRFFGVGRRTDGEQPHDGDRTRGAHPHITARSRFFVCLT